MTLACSGKERESSDEAFGGWKSRVTQGEGPAGHNKGKLPGACWLGLHDGCFQSPCLQNTRGQASYPLGSLSTPPKWGDPCGGQEPSSCSLAVHNCPVATVLSPASFLSELVAQWNKLAFALSAALHTVSKSLPWKCPHEVAASHYSVIPCPGHTPC